MSPNYTFRNIIYHLMWVKIQNLKPQYLIFSVISGVGPLFWSAPPFFFPNYCNWNKAVGCWVKLHDIYFILLYFHVKILEFDWLRNIWQTILLPQRVHILHPPSDNSWQQSHVTMHDNGLLKNYFAYRSP
jgi:hypothetical protein